MIERDGRQLRSTRGELLAVATNEESAALLVNTYSDLYEALKNALHWLDEHGSKDDAKAVLRDALKKAEERL